MNRLFSETYKGRRVLVTGHTGFKGSWLALWLSLMGAGVVGYSLAPETQPNHFDLLDITCDSIISDIRNKDKLKSVIFKYQPEIIFHLAAQPLVRRSYLEPINTFETNVMGTVNLLNSCREATAVRAVLVVTSDKCYENQQLNRGYCENDPLGGYDPYSASKGCTEIVTSSYRRSFFPIEQFGKKHNVLVASARVGNVIGGGDWSEDRLIPDIVKAVSKKEKVFIRNPVSTRPWQHVLESLAGYFILGQKMLMGDVECATAWNFGPYKDGELSVEHMIKKMQQVWGGIEYQVSESNEMHEAKFLQLDSTKARTVLGWSQVWGIDETVEKTSKWYQQFYEKQKVITGQQISEYVKTARDKKLDWAL